MNGRNVIGRLIVGPALVLLVLAVVAIGQISTSLDLLHDVRGIDRLQLAMRSNSEAMVRLYAARSVWRQIETGTGGDRSQIGGETRQALLQEAERLGTIANGLAWIDATKDAAGIDRELLLNLSSLMSQAATSQVPDAYAADLRRVHKTLDGRLKERDQIYHEALTETAASARREAEAAIPVAILLGMVGVMTALAAGLVSVRGFIGSLDRLAQAIRKIAKGEGAAALEAAQLGREFGEISETLALFQRMTLERNSAIAALAESEEGLKRVLEAAPVPLAMTKPNEGRLVYANRHCRALFMVERPDEGMDVRQFYVDPAERDKLIEQLRRHGELRNHEIMMRRADGVPRLLQVSAVQVVYRQETVIVLGYDDVTERKAMVERLQDSEEKLRLIVETAPIPLVLTRIADDTLLYVNAQATKLFQVGADEIVLGKPASNFWIDPQERNRMKELLAKCGVVRNFETRLKHAHGDGWFWAQLSAAGTEFRGEPVLLVAIEDISERRKLEEELRRHITTDPLTGLSNRPTFLDAAGREFARARRYGHELSLLVFDIDGLKRLNVAGGHEAGDRAIVAVIGRCRPMLREIDLIGRLGGGTFAVLLPETGEDEALAVAQRLLAAAREPLADENAPPIATVAIGLARLTSAEGDFDALQGRAEQALALAKKAGGNCLRA